MKTRPASLLFLAIAALAAGCQIVLGVDPAELDGGTGKGAGGSGASSSTGGQGGAPAPCLSATGCPGVDTECSQRACVDGLCTRQHAEEGTPVTTQAPADCRKRVCDGAGSVKLADDPADLLDDGNECTTDACQDGVPRNTAKASGFPCGGGARVCNDLGACVECVSAAQCAGLLCANNHCVAATCVNQVKDGTETAADCGGPSCEPCADGKPCLVGSDCLSGICGGAPRTCLVATCDDGQNNGTESDVDCGGACGTRCGPGEGCKVDGDCLGGACSGSVCLASCADGLRNGGETGLDCGGSVCPPCALGGGCAFDADCAVGYCRGGTCVPAGCTDGKKGTFEADVDCGGQCAPCGPGKACEKASDCLSGVCAGGLCATPSCNDHTKNGSETGVDCGGPGCGACPDGQACAGGADCQSAICLASVCVAQGCQDGVKDLAETDVDCGGGACPGCGSGKTCAMASDCISNVCLSGKCTGWSCNDSIKNGGETDKDCGGPCVECGLGKGCKVAADCATVACSGGVCVPPTCSDLYKNGSETGVDCGGPVCDPCPGGQGCVVPADCASMVCTAGVCGSACDNLVKDGGETGVDCGGPCAGCPPGGPCNTGADCASQLCNAGACATPSCSDGVKNASESDVDCGGTCALCQNGKKCAKGTDCASGGCAGGVCQQVLLISQVRSNGAGGFGDDFVELYNPGSTAVTMDQTWKLMHQSAQGGCQASITRFTGGGQVIPPHGHLLIGGLMYTQSPAKDETFENVNVGMSLADAGSLWVVHGSTVLDAFCYAYDAASLATLMGGCPVPYVCEGMPVSNLPHDGSSSGSSASDVSLERKPGGSMGNGQDTGDTATDFRKIAPAVPRNLLSAPAP